MNLFGVPFDKIDASHILALEANNSSESQTLDFKLTLPSEGQFNT